MHDLVAAYAGSQALLDRAQIERRCHAADATGSSTLVLPA
jgi:hypothetical protein